MRAGRFSLCTEINFAGSDLKDMGAQASRLHSKGISFVFWTVQARRLRSHVKIEVINEIHKIHKLSLIFSVPVTK